PIWLVVDNASWHHSKALDWHHIKPLHLPPYSPDFNPIERLWQHLRGGMGQSRESPLGSVLIIARHSLPRSTVSSSPQSLLERRVRMD
ncbi:MAG: transposase, partial [Verrucomicrobiales bacterium]|nr:transposase [Verrucomicrobiales bacterium]